jgi:MFS family permease
LLRFHGDAATTAVEEAAFNYQSASIIAAGADARGVSILTTLINLSLALVCFKAPTLIKKAGLGKRGAIILAFTNLLAWVPLTLAFLLTQLGITPGWFTVLWFINVGPGMLLSFHRDNWLSSIIPNATLGRYLGQRLAIKSAFYLGGFFVLGYILDKLGKDNLAGFAVIFTIALAVGLIDFIIFTFMSEKNTETTTVPRSENVVAPKLDTIRFSIPEYFKELKEKKLDLFILFTTFFYLTVGLSGPLYAIYILNDLHFSYLSYTCIISAEFLARVISAPIWGRFADKEGNIRVLGIVSRIIPLMPIFWLFCHNLGYLIAVQLISGACWGAFDLCTQSYLYKVAPQSKKLHYIIYTRCLILIFSAVGGLLSALCINDIFATFGSKILSIFWISGVARIIVVIYLMPKLVDLAVSLGQSPSPPVVDLEILRQALTSKRGQFYRREQQVADAASRIQKITEMIASDTKEYADYRKWTVPEKVSPAKPVSIPVAKPASNLRLSHYREAMAAQTFTKPALVHHEIGLNAERLKIRYDLERQLKALTARAEEAMTHHGIEENAERLKQRFHLNPENAMAAISEKSITRHEIEQNMDRLKLRYRINLQPAAAAPFLENGLLNSHSVLQEKAKSSAGLYRDKVSWANYMKESFDAVLREKGQPVPVAASTYNRDNASEGIFNRSQLLKIDFRRSPVLV